MKRNRMIKVFMTLFIAMLACFGSSVDIFAAAPEDIGDVVEDDPTETTIQKKFRMNEGVETPAVTFEFAFEKISYNGKTEQAVKDDMPELDASVSFAAGETPTPTPTPTGTPSKVKEIIKDSNEFLTGVVFAKKGVYRYKVTEKAVTYSEDMLSTIVSSKAEYELVVYVDETLAVEAIANILKVADAAGQTLDHKMEQMIYTNTFIKNNGGTDPTDPDDIILYIKENTIDSSVSAPFEYHVKVTKSAVVTDASPKYIAYVLDDQGAIISDPTTLVKSETTGYTPEFDEDASGNTYILLPADGTTDVTIMLTNGQQIVFIDAPVGTEYDIVAESAPDFSSTAIIIEGNGTPMNYYEDDYDVPLAVGIHLIADGSNSAEFTHTYQDITPTGVVLNRLPFIIMVTMALGMIMFFVVWKSHKREEEEEELS